MNHSEIRPQAQMLLRHAHEIGALKLDPNGIKLKSGRLSPHFFSTGDFSSGADASVLMAAYVAAVAQHGVLGHENSYVVLGPPYKGTMLAYGYVTAHGGANVFAASYRKEKKDHGEGGLHLGRSLADMNVLLIDDVATTGTSILEAAEYAKACGAKRIIGCVIAFDRQERAHDDPASESAVQSLIRKLGAPVIAAANLDDLLLYLGGINQLTIAAHVERYREQYGA